MADTKMVKSVGEHWVCATLARHGWAPALTRDGVERTDILAVATTLQDRPMVEIQVKTASKMSNTTSWPLSGKAQLLSRSPHEWFVFVLLPQVPQPPKAFVVPRDHVSAATWIVHQDWLTDPGVPSGKRNVGLDRARVREAVWAGYEDRWDLLAMPTTEVPVLLPGWLRTRALEERVGLPSGHPWATALPEW
jgi:hypothetical protein